MIRLILQNEKVWPRKIVSGVQPTGILHIGNYFGAIRPWVDIQNRGDDASYFIADLHSMTLPYVSVPPAKNQQHQLIQFIACRMWRSCARIYSKWLQHYWPVASIRQNRIYSCNQRCRSTQNCVGFSVAWQRWLDSLIYRNSKKNRPRWRTYQPVCTHIPFSKQPTVWFTSKFQSISLLAEMKCLPLKLIRCFQSNACSMRWRSTPADKFGAGFGKNIQ